MPQTVNYGELTTRRVELDPLVQIVAAVCPLCMKAGESKHILAIVTGSNIRLLAAMRTWGMDGTFKVVPQWYQQLFTIHALYRATQTKFSFFALFVAFVMTVLPKLRHAPNCCGGMSFVHEGRALAKCTDKKGCGGAIWTNLDVTSVIKRNDHIESCPVDEHLAYKMEKKAVLKKRSAEHTKPIPAIYDEEASAASAVPSTSGHFPLFKRVKSTMYCHRAKRYSKFPNHRRDVQIPFAFRTVCSSSVPL
ncbi:hypothetical protein T03_17813 [Trichinella britovi]|uniref:FLYWCH-type domain-containing protein n=1 Tax=Trichinella britovi TaxID=45882 RepID=A0A0V1C6E1_TRIBR|nr:hypothetical protein T03_17813 [Trichinella britovi]